MTTKFKERCGPVAKSERTKHFTPSSWHKPLPGRNLLPRRVSQVNGSHLPNFTPIPLLSEVPAWKRVLDVTCILASLPLSIPLLLAVAMWIRLISRGPALFRQQRIGLRGRPFTLYKFRSMDYGARTSDHETHVSRLVESDCPMVKLDLLGDSRLILGGCFLRTAGLDELPQLLNVLRGQMSLVGPRPCLPEELGFFTTAQRERFAVLPGITGLWQVNGKNCTTFKEMNLLDVKYARASSPVLDLRIMIRTPMALLRQVYQCVVARHSAIRLARIDEPELGYVTQRLSDQV